MWILLRILNVVLFIDTSEQGYIIVTNGDKIHQVSLDGSRNQILISNLSHAVGIDYDYRYEYNKKE